MIYPSILDCIGHTPLIELTRIHEPGEARIIAKFEGLNVGGSIKTRTAYRMISEALHAGVITQESIIVEPTSGNQGIGIALVCAVLGLKTIIIMPDSVSVERRKLVEQYGADIIVVPDEGDIGACIERCCAEAERLAQENPLVFIPQQFKNHNNVAAHRDGTAQEILEDIDCEIHGFCSGIGTGGTITGVGSVLKEQFPNIHICAVEPEHAAILSGNPIGTHMQMGIGDGLIPDILDCTIYDSIEIVTDEEALTMSKLLAHREGIVCGISSGTNVVAAKRLARTLGEGKTVVVLLPDTGERYFSTPLFDR